MYMFLYEDGEKKSCSNFTGILLMPLLLFSVVLQLPSADQLGEVQPACQNSSFLQIRVITILTVAALLQIHHHPYFRTTFHSRIQHRERKTFCVWRQLISRAGRLSSRSFIPKMIQKQFVMAYAVLMLNTVGVMS